MPLTPGLIGTVVAGVNEQEAIRLALDLAHRFSWKVSVWTTEDIETEVEEQLGRPATKEDVEKVREMSDWRNLDDRMGEEGSRCLSDAVWEYSTKIKEETTQWTS